MLLVNHAGLVLAAERSGIAGAWQAPQGGLEPGETPLDAARRELREELGVDWSRVEVLAEYPIWLGYELPPDAQSAKTGRGQVHKWFLLRYGTGDPDVEQSDPEFRAWRWVPMAKLISDAWPIRRSVYRALAEAWSDQLRSTD
jgi:putative (di)nucleoside polyphosphate hydrolase